MELDAEALELIQNTAVTAAAVNLFSEAPDGRKKFFSQGSGQFHIDVPPPNRRHIVATLQDILRYHDLACRRDGSAPTRRAFWFCIGGVILVLDDDDRRDTVMFPLRKSRQWGKLEDLEKNATWVGQSEAIRVLKLDLGVRDAALLGKFRRLDWSHSTEGKAEVQRGRESISRSVQQEIQGIESFPETFTLACPIFLNSREDVLYAVDCYVELDVVNTRIQIGPVLGEIERVEHLHMANIRARLEAGVASVAGLEPGESQSQSTAIYFGTP
jgi:hypothetical protein